MEGNAVDLAEARRDRDLERFSQQGYAALGKRPRNPGQWPLTDDRPWPHSARRPWDAKRRALDLPEPDGSPIRHDWPYGPPREVASALVRECCAKIDCEHANSEWPADLENAEWQGRLTKPRESASAIFERYGLLDAIHSEGPMAIARLAGMSERQAKAWTLSVERGLSVREIAREMAVRSVGTVAEHLISARAKVYRFALEVERQHGEGALAA